MSHDQGYHTGSLSCLMTKIIIQDRSHDQLGLGLVLGLGLGLALSYRTRSFSCLMTKIIVQDQIILVSHDEDYRTGPDLSRVS